VFRNVEVLTQSMYNYHHHKGVEREKGYPGMASCLCDAGLGCEQMMAHTTEEKEGKPASPWSSF